MSESTASTENKTSLKKTLISLLEEYNIIIPIIQRDYAQGRDNNNAAKVRKNLIRDIINCISDENKKIDFNFVYGYTDTDTDTGKKTFYPVDGQQRLTSLYLLHWLISGLIKKDDFFNYDFSYMTRSSATDFFKKLKSNDEDIRDFFDTIKGKNKEEKETIPTIPTIKNAFTNPAWFLSTWNNDPTVKSALNFIAELTVELYKKMKLEEELLKKYYERLEKGAITFSFISESDESNADEKTAISYIRMNARGKPLTDFENVKAMLDSISEKIGKSSIISQYDNSFINILYENSAGGKLEEKTDQINKKSMYLVRNLYQLIVNKEGAKDDTSFNSVIFEDSLKQEVDTKYKEYFDMLYSVMKFCEYDSSLAGNQEKEYFKYIQDVFSCSQSIASNRSLVAKLYFICYYQQKHEKSPEKSCCDDAMYILECLNYTKWSQGIECIKNAMEIIAEKEEAFDVDIQNLGDKTGIDDMAVRIKELDIKIGIIKCNKISHMFFNDYELLFEKKGANKLQAMLYIAGYWNGPGDFKKLESYLKIAETYLSDEKEIEWRKDYALSAYSDDNFSLNSAENIEKECGENKHIWNNVFYFWNDEIDQNLADKKELELIKKVYDNNQLVSARRDEIQKSAYYDNCWLKYAVKFDYSELLTQELSFIDGTVFVNGQNGKPRKFAQYFFSINNKAKFGYKNFKEEVKDMNKVDSRSFFRTFYLHLTATFDIGGELPCSNKDEENSMHIYEVDKDKNIKKYKVYVFNGYSYKEYIYTVTNEEKTKEDRKNAFRTQLETIISDQDKCNEILDYNKCTVKDVEIKWKKKTYATREYLFDGEKQTIKTIAYEKNLGQNYEEDLRKHLKDLK